VRTVVAVTPEVNAGMWLPAEHFAVRTKFSAPLIYPNLQQSLQQNKTAGLVTLEGLEADGR
jgi:aromatic ring hydroxylase